MSKLYEVLENASREREMLETARTPVIRPCQLPTWKTDMEMMGLYQAMNTALGKKMGRIVQFMGTQAGEGCSTIVRHLAEAAATKVEESVLLLDLEPGSSFSDATPMPRSNIIWKSSAFRRNRSMRHSARRNRGISP